MSSCIIVGMGPGLSAALARRFAAEGLSIVGIARDHSKLAAIAAEMAADGLAFEGLRADASDLAGLQEVIGAVQGPVDALIYNAYRATYAMPSQLDPEACVADFRVNVAAALASTQAVLPGMLAAGRGTVLFTGGGLALDPTGWLEAASLAVGKAGLRSLALTLNRELAPQGVRVGTVTVVGTIASGTVFAPERVAEAFWRLHSAPEDSFAGELVFRGEV